MEDEIKVGEWIRAKDGNIDKIKYADCIILNKDITGENHLYGYIDIAKHSPNIIDLIEVGDYVNGEPVEEVIKNEFDLPEITTTTEYLANEEDIKSIVTKEQFKSIEYTIHEREEKENEGD